jgi:hypothetical protein
LPAGGLLRGGWSFNKSIAYKRRGEAEFPEKSLSPFGKKMGKENERKWDIQAFPEVRGI